MATIYKIEIEMVSPWVNYDEETIKQVFEDLLKKRKIDKLKQLDRLEGIEIKITRS